MPDGAGEPSRAIHDVARHAVVRHTVAQLRRTPCIGICSTTYGDLVCRGCKRFAHEIVGWNGYRDEQRDLVWARLHALLAQSVRVYLCIVDEALLLQAAKEARVPDAATLPHDVLAFQTMRFRPQPLAALGLAACAGRAMETRDALSAIDREFHLRSQAYYEASFKIPTRLVQREVSLKREVDSNEK